MGKDLTGKELGEGIIQKKTGIYEARYVDRFGKRKSVAGKDLKDVKKRFNEAIYENQKEINSKRHYNHVFRKHISPYLGNFYIKDITQLQIRELIKKLGKDGYQYETKNKVRILLLDMSNISSRL